MVRNGNQNPNDSMRQMLAGLQGLNQSTAWFGDVSRAAKRFGQPMSHQWLAPKGIEQTNALQVGINALWSLTHAQRTEFLAMLTRWNETAPSKLELGVRFENGNPVFDGEHNAVNEARSWPHIGDTMRAAKTLLDRYSDIGLKLRIESESGVRSFRLCLLFMEDDQTAVDRYCSLLDAWCELPESDHLELGFERR